MVFVELFPSLLLFKNYGFDFFEGVAHESPRDVSDWPIGGTQSGQPQPNRYLKSTWDQVLPPTEKPFVFSASNFKAFLFLVVKLNKHFVLFFFLGLLNTNKTSDKRKAENCRRLEIHLKNTVV